MVCAATGHFQHVLSSDLHTDRFIREYIAVVEGDVSPSDGKIDLPIGRVPGSDNLVLVYNKFREEKRLREKERLLEVENYELKPLAIIPELDLTLYSRCIALRMDKDGNFSSLQNGDGRILVKYLAR